MNVIWITADTFRRDQIGAYGNNVIHTPVLDALAARGTRFDNHYACGFPTMPTRADHHTGQWTMSFMGWDALPDDTITLSQILGDQGVHTAAVIDTPFYTRGGMNYDRGFQSYFAILGQEGSGTRAAQIGHHESRDVVADWRKEADRCAARTMTQAGDWLEKHYKEEFFLYIDTWDPHEPWDPPAYYAELYQPDYDGSIIQPPYAYWYETEHLTERDLETAFACYRGEITMVDTWIGYLLRKVQNMGIQDDTAIIFTTDHGFYFGEHGGYLGKMHFGRRPNGQRYFHGDPDSIWDFSPLYEELVHIPLLIHVPGVAPGSYDGFSAALDVMPTVLEIMGREIPSHVQGQSLLSGMRDAKHPSARDFAISTIPFANTDDTIRSVDNVERSMSASQVTTVTSGDYSFLYSMDPGRSQLFHLPTDPGQQTNIISANMDTAKDIHQLLLKFMRDTNVPQRLIDTRLELKM